MAQNFTFRNFYLSHHPGQNRLYPFMFQKISLLNSKKNFQRSYLHNGLVFENKTLLLFFNGPNIPYKKITSDTDPLQQFYR